MSMTSEKIDGNMAVLTITVPAEDFNKELKKLSNKNSIGLFEKNSSEFKLRVYVGIMTETYQTDVSLAAKLFCQ